MASIIPTYDVPKVETAPAAKPQATPAGPETFGSELAKGVALAGQAVDQYQQTTDHSAVLSARNELNNRLNELARDTDVDPETGQPLGYLNRTGPAAKGVGQEFENDLQENLEDIRSKLSNDTQRQAFDVLAQKHIETYAIAVHEHEFKQNAAYQEQVAQAAVDQSFNLLAQNFDSPELVSSHISDGITAIRSSMAAKGITDPLDPVTVAKVGTFESLAHKTVIDSYIKAGRVAEAKDYFEAYNSPEPERDAEGKPVPGTEGSVFTADDVLKIESYLKPLSDHQTAFDAADRVYDNAKTLEQMDQQLREDPSLKGQPELINQARTEIHARRSNYDTDVSKQGAQVTKEVYGLIAQKIMDGKTPNLSDIPPDKIADLIKYNGQGAEQLVRDIQTYGKNQASKVATDKIVEQMAAIELRGGVVKVSDIPKSDWDALKAADPEKAMQLAEHIKQGQEHSADRWREQQNRPTSKQTQNYVDLLSNPTSLRSANLNQMFTQGLLTKDMVTHLAAEQGTMSTKMDKDPVIENNRAMVTHVLEGNGITAKKNPAAFNQMFMDLYDWAKSQQTPPNQGDYAAKAKQLIEMKVTEGGLWNSQEPLVKVPAEKIVVPAADRSQILASFKKLNVTPSELQIQNVYRRSVINGGGK